VRKLAKTLRVPGSEVQFSEALRVWAKLGVLSFGGPAGQVALMHQELVERRRWLDEDRFLHALNYCMLLPGPEAQQLAAYIGWLMHGTRGGITAGVLFVLPGFCAVLALSMVYATLGQQPGVAALFFGLKAAVLAVVVEAVLRIGKRALKSRMHLLLAGLAFVSLFAFAAPFPLIVLGAGLTGLVGVRLLPAAFPEAAGAPERAAHDTVLDRMAAAGQLEHTRPSRARALRVLLVCVALWGLPIVLLAHWCGPHSVLVQQGLFFSRAAVVTFGGAYAVLAYIAQEAVSRFHWLLPGEMLDGLSLAETTPGPLILVVEFVGFLGAFRQPAELPPLLAGTLGALITVWVTFVPCFLWIFLGAPYVESLRRHRGLRAALAAITAAVVGVILNLSLWFALHVWFTSVTEVSWGPLRLHVPRLDSLSPSAALLSALALLAMLKWKLGMPKTLAASAALGLAWKLLVP
jgi:chromate transporter